MLILGLKMFFIMNFNTSFKFSKQVAIITKISYENEALMKNYPNTNKKGFWPQKQEPL